MPRQIIDTIKAKGYRLTKGRIAIVEYLTSQKGLFRVSDIIEALPMIDQVSIYRTIDLLEELDVIHMVTEKDGHRVYERHNEAVHHVECTGCNYTVTTPCNCSFSVKGFDTVHHVTHVAGLCKSCQPT